MKRYDPKKIEPKWQKYWAKNNVFEASEDTRAEKFYGLIEFPYPSGEGLHVGHPRPFTAMDVITRKKRMEGKNVLFPIGFDAFGLPTENFAIKTGKPPAEVTKKNIANFTRQLNMLGFGFDWSRQVDTTDPNYYKWTQWLFLQFYKHGLAYKKNQPINWCPKDKIGLANEEVVSGCCERCGTAVEKRNKEQWMLAITKYAEKLLAGLNNVDYIERAKVQQENWIGKSEGAEVIFPLQVSGQPEGKYSVTVFTTRPDTIFGVTFLAISAELAQSWVDAGWQASDEVKKYISETLQNKNTTREEQEKTGVDSGITAVNPVSKEEVPVWITNYVMSGVGAGAIMGVPAHDERDFDFAKKFGLPVKQVVKGSGEISELFTEEGVAVNSEFLNGFKTDEAKEKMISWLEEHKIGKRQVNYKLRDWVFSRQRYWGEPIPLVFCEQCKNKKQKVLLIHGYRSSGVTTGALQKQLEAHGFEVLAPIMSTKDEPVWEKWMEELMPYIEQLGEDDIVVGHSLGGHAALSILAKMKKKIGALYLLAPAYGNYDTRYWEQRKREGVDTIEHVELLQKFIETPVDVAVVSDLVKNKMVIWSEDDTHVPRPIRSIFSSDWYFNIVQGFGHFNRYEGSFISDLITAVKQNGWVPLPESELPLKLPKVEKYQPTDTGESPLAAIEKWVKTTCPECGGPARRETDTMPNWAGSSWYFLAYALGGEKTLKEKGDKFWNIDLLKQWQPVDWYNGGMEHTVLHLLYSRFWNQFLYDIGLVSTSEPYAKRTSHGMILAKGGEKMSKSRGNVVNPDEMVEQFGADALRTYIMFMGPFDQAVEWDTNGLVGVKRFLDKVWNLQEKIASAASRENQKLETLLHQTIKKVTEDIDAMRFNTAIAKMMELVNELAKADQIQSATYASLVQILSPFAPHICEELWQILGSQETLARHIWPQYDEKLVVENEITLAIQVNGKLRDTIVAPADISEDDAKKLALQSEHIRKWLDGKEPKKVIYVKGKLVSVVV